jgi:membrane protease YdiL (CAAX protease family)
VKSGLLHDSRGRLRSGWRFASWLALVAIFWTLVAYVLRFLGVGWVSTGVEAALVLAVALPSIFLWRSVDGRRFLDTPLAPTHRAGRVFGVGILSGIGMVVIAVALLYATDGYRLDLRPCDTGAQTTFLVRWLSVFALAAAIEELLFRGYGLFALRDGLGEVPAIALTSLIFSLAHAGNPHYGWPAALAILWIGALLAAWVLVSGTLWGAFGIHLGWNAALAIGAAIPVSGLRIAPPCYVGVVEGPQWWTGGPFGLEAGLLAVVVWGVAAVAIGWLELARRSGGS